MRAYQVKTADGIDAIEQITKEIPTPKDDEILI